MLHYPHHSIVHAVLTLHLTSQRDGTTSVAPADRGDAGHGGSGLNLSALRTDQPSPRGNGGGVDEEALLAKFREQIDAWSDSGTKPDPTQTSDRPPSSGGGLNLSALDGEKETGPAWVPEALEAIKAAGAAGMKPSAIAVKVGRSRQAVRDALKAAAERGELVYRDNGPHSVYVHPDHA